MKAEIQVQDITVEVERKAIKNLYIRIKPDGRVVLTCPKRTTQREIRYLIEERYHWIVTHRQKVLERQAAQPKDYVSGEAVSLWGKRYRLRVERQPGRAFVTLEGEELVLRGTAEDEAERKQALDAFYRAQLNTAIPPLLEQAQSATGLRAQEWRVRNMRTRWGSCNVQKRRIWLSLNLAKYPTECLYCVIIHELTHLLEPGHNERFYALMEQFYPGWREANALLKAGTF